MDTPNITSCDEYRSFWISWADGNINVGFGAIVGFSEFMFWQDPEPNAVAYLSISGWANDGDWEIIQFIGQKHVNTSYILVFTMSQNSTCTICDAESLFGSKCLCILFPKSLSLIPFGIKWDEQTSFHTLNVHCCLLSIQVT